MRTVCFMFACVLASPVNADEVQTIEPPEIPDRNPTPDLKAIAASIVERTNTFRKEEGRGPTRASDTLGAAAQYFADYMAKNDKYGHTADGTKPADRATAHKYVFCLVSENIAYAYSSKGFNVDQLAEKFTTNWKNSPGHRRNMLDPDATETAVAVARSEKTGYYYGVQMFGRPMSDAIEFSIENKAGEPATYKIGEQSHTLNPRFTRTHSLCRSEEIVFDFGQTADKSDVVKPTKGAKFVVAKTNGKWSLRKE
jgi:uncharacterized protein YkwD